MSRGEESQDSLSISSDGGGGPYQDDLFTAELIVRSVIAANDSVLNTKDVRVRNVRG